MKKLLVLMFVCLGFVSSIYAQEKKERPNKEQTDKGKWFIQTDLGSKFPNNNLLTTSISFNNEDSWSLGLSGGYFIKKNLAITAGLGYGKGVRSVLGYDKFSYKLGAKYYFKNNIFLSADFGGSSIDLKSSPARFLGQFDPNKFKTGVTAGYAWFIGKYLSLEPSLGIGHEFDKYNSLLSIDLNLGISVHF